MNRRSFLKGLALVGATALVADKLVSLAEADESAGLSVIETAPARYFPPMGADVFLLHRITLFGCETESRMATFGLARSGGDVLMMHQFNVLNYLDWIAAPGEEIAVLRSAPLEIRGNFDGACNVIGRTNKGTVHHHFIMTKGSGATGRVYQLDAPTFQEMRRCGYSPRN